MAVTMTGEILLPADRMTVWTKLNDPEVLKRCISGLQTMERTGDNTFAASVKMKIGPVSATFRGRVELSDIDAPNRYRISGAGEGGVAGFAKGGADVVLTETPEGTLLRYDAQATVGGKIAQMGARLVDGVGKKTADAFFARFAAECTGGDVVVVVEVTEVVTARA